MSLLQQKSKVSLIFKNSDSLQNTSQKTLNKSFSLEIVFQKDLQHSRGEHLRESCRCQVCDFTKNYFHHVVLKGIWKTTFRTAILWTPVTGYIHVIHWSFTYATKAFNLSLFWWRHRQMTIDRLLKKFLPKEVPPKTGIRTPCTDCLKRILFA